MIERYTLPKMGRVWSDQHKYDLWLMPLDGSGQRWQVWWRLPERVWSVNAVDAASVRDLFAHQGQFAASRALAEVVAPSSPGGPGGAPQDEPYPVDPWADEALGGGR